MRTMAAPKPDGAAATPLPRPRALTFMAAAVIPFALFLVLGDSAMRERLLLGAVLAGAALICAVVSHSTTPLIPTVWGVTAVGTALQLRLGVQPTHLMFLVALATAAFCITTISIARHGRIVGRGERTVVTGLALIVAAFVGRLVPAMTETMAAGSVPVGGQTVQIGEFTRILLIAGCALVAWHAAQDDRSSIRFPLVWTAAICAGTGLAVLLVVDSGPAVVAAVGILASVVFITGRVRTVRAGMTVAAVLIAAVTTAAILAAVSGAGDRLTARMANVSTPDYQLDLGLTAAAAGGLIGRGIGSSPLALHIPEAQTDMLPAVAAADLGHLPLALLIGATLIVLSGLLGRVSRFGTPAAAAAFGCVTAIITQVVITTFGSLGGIPLTGLSTSFLVVTGSTVVPAFLVLGLACGIGDGRLELIARATPTRTLVMQTTTVATVLFLLSRVLVPIDESSGALFRPTGDVLTSNGEVIATTNNAGDRVYVSDDLYTEIGYSVLGYASYGLESTAQHILTCSPQGDAAQIALQIFRPLACEPAAVSTTLRADLQRAAAAATDGLRADVVVSDAWTGNLYALYASDQVPQSELGRDDSPLAPSRLAETAPGSTFKLFLAAAALINGIDATGGPTDMVDTGDAVIYNNGHALCPDNSLETMIAFSCNTSAATLALQLGPAALEDVARTYFGADTPLPFDGGDVMSLRTGLTEDSLSPGQLARSGIGQESVRTSPLALAAATGVIAVSAAGTGVDGAIPAPRLIGGVCFPESEVPQSVNGSPAVFGQVLPDGIGVKILDAMQASADHGTTARLGDAADALALDLAAKSGTAEVDDSRTGISSWVTAIINERFVVTVLVHDGDTTTNQAVDIAKDLLPAVADAINISPPQCSAKP